MSAPLIDGFGRVHDNLRISVTDRCNIRCFYCMPETGVKFMPRGELLTFEEIERVARIAAELGITKIRVTGGEPLLRRGLPVLIERLMQVPGIRDLALTTNAVLLEEFAPALYDAGLRRLNIHLDTLDRARFQQITRRDDLPAVLRGINAARRLGFGPIKINVVAVKDLIEPDLVPMARYCRENGFEPRFIEFMPLDADELWREDQVLTGGEIRALIEERYGPLVELPAKASSTARRYGFADGIGELGFVNPVSEPFCSSCDRIRLTADGQLRTCLFSRREWDLKTPLRDGSSDEQLVAALRNAVAHKELKHRINERGFVRASRSMSQIGG